MKFKVDENLGQWSADMLAAAGHDACTVAAQNLVGTPDRDLALHCAAESRCLVTLDKEFGNPLIYPPAEFAGIVLIRYPDRGGRPTLEHGVHTLINALQTAHNATGRKDLVGTLWIVQRGAVREYAPLPPDDDSGPD